MKGAAGFLSRKRDRPGWSPYDLPHDLNRWYFTDAMNAVMLQ